MALKQSDPQAYAAALARVELARMAGLDARETRGPVAPPAGMGRSLDALVSHLNAAYAGGASDETTRAAKLSDIRRGVVYACTTLRADMLAGLPIYLYRVNRNGSGRGQRMTRAIDRAGKPARVGGVRLADVSSVERVDGSPVTKLLARPNADWSGDMLIRMTEMGLCLVGQSHWRLMGVNPNGTGRPTAIDWYKHSRLEPVKRTADTPADVKGRTVIGWKLDDHAPGDGGLSAAEVVWMRYPDPNDPDYGTLAPAQIAALGADSYAAAMGSNRDVFKQGLRAAGAFVPPEEMVSFGWDQAEELTRDVNDLLIGQRNNHRVPVFPFRYDFRAFNVTPRDAEFIALMEFAIEDVARAFRIPIEMVGGTRRTYQSTETADRALWQRCLEPEAKWIANELTIKFLPAFGLDDSYFIGFDFSDVVALQEDEDAEWTRDSGQLTAGVKTVDEWREAHGMEPFEAEAKPLLIGQMTTALQVAQLAGTGQISPEQAQALLTYAVGLDSEAAKAIAGDGMMEADDTGADTEGDTEDDAGEPMQAGAPRPTGRRAVEWDSAEHRGILERADKAEAPIRKAFESTVSKLFDRQLESILAQMGGDTERAARDLPTMADIARWFNRARWIKEFRTAAKPHYEDAAVAAGKSVYGDLKVDGSFDTGAPTAVNYMRRKAQRFATEVNDTTWQRLRGTLVNGIEAAETIPQLRDRVQAVMTSQSNNWAGVVALTETHAAYQGASVLAAKQAGEDAGLELEKEWVSALDERVRETHREAHGQTRPIDEEYEVGGSRGMAPGEIDDPGESIGCRCTSVYNVVKPKRTVDRSSEALYELLASLPR